MTDRWAGTGWAIEVAVGEGTASVALNGEERQLDAGQIGQLSIERPWIRWQLHLDGHRLGALRGLRRSGATELAETLRAAARRPAVDHALQWHHEVHTLLTEARATQRWIATEPVEALEARRPDPSLATSVEIPAFAARLTPDEVAACRTTSIDLRSAAAAVNEEIVASSLRDHRAFFDTIEKQPLTDEQARAVLCFDNRVQLLAAAGSGKTSVMVARAAYAVHRGWVTPDRILLLAFNKDAARELQTRIAERCASAGIDSEGVRAQTFHSFGLEAIGKATGSKPRLAPWLEQGRDLEVVMELVDELRDSSPAFRYRWDLYRTIFSRAPIDLEAHEPDGWDADARVDGYRTLAGEVVKSHGERTIADFLFLNGVRYAYERPYDVDVSDPTHSQYRPDFYYPEIDAWHEHWALGTDGRPPKEFVGYEASMAWKREVHRAHGTTLVETSWAELVFGDGLATLAARLTELGLELDWNPDRPPKDAFAKVARHEDLARLIRTFMSHVKSNGLTREAIDAKVQADPRAGGFRTRLFLEVYWDLHDAWQRRLAESGSIDFEDMLVLAANHLERSTEAAFDLVMVDEFQDASRARARLVRALVSQPGRHLLTVGDDWQAINRFAGADIGVMRDFGAWFGTGPQLALTATFRCTQRTSDVARRFVTRNPNQFAKPMRSASGAVGMPVTVVRAIEPTAAIHDALAGLSRDAGRAAGPVSVMVLGRYGFERDLVPREVFPGLDVRFLTVHRSKGLEANHVIVANLGTGTYGFPSTITDDPVLGLALPSGEPFPHAEERRLLYVALTRARRSVTLVAPSERMSPFAVELVQDPDVVVTGASGDVEVCDRCGNGTMVARTGRYGRFLGCSTFPACKNTRNL